MRFSIHNPDVVACAKRAYTNRDNYELRSKFRMELKPHGGPYLFGDPEDEGTGVWVYTPDGKFVG